MSKVYSSGKIGNLEIRNRFVMTAINLFYCPDGYVNDRLIEFYRARAKGGVGLIVAGVISVDDNYVMANDVISMHNDTYIPGLEKLAGAVHEEGAKIFSQLWHMGAYASSNYLKGDNHPVAPSAVFSNFSREMPRELTIEEIDSITENFGKAAKRSKEAGFDGVELIGSAGYLISQFLSPKTNKRTDKYGGDLANRMTFLLEIVEKVRKYVGEDYPIMVRLSGNEFVPEGNTLEESVEIAKQLELAGVNAIDVTGGWHETGIPQLTMDVPNGAYLYLAKTIRKAVNIPVVASNRMDSYGAEKFIDAGGVDFIGICRSFISDPELVNKAKSGDHNLINTCIGCNQGCMDNVFAGKSLTCMINPEAGREAELLVDGKLPRELKAGEQKNILVIGSGASGMQYAGLSAEKGHRVTVWEQGETYGGQLHLAGAPYERKDFMKLNEYLYSYCQKNNVAFEFGKKASASDIVSEIKASNYDKVVLATGAEPMNPPFEIEEGAHVVQAWDVLLEKVELGKNVVVVGGGAVGVETSTMLAQKGTIDAETFKFLSLNRAESPKTLYKLATRGDKNVTILEMQKRFGADIGPSSRWIMIGNLKRYHVNMINLSRVVRITKEGVECENVETKEKFIIPAETVVLAVGSKSVNSLSGELKEQLGDVDVIGDANRPGKVMEAMRSAYELAIRQ